MQPAASVHDVAAYILAQCGPMSAMKLQKLVYYCQAWSLVWDDRPLFGEPIEAWKDGPVVRALYERHRGARTVAVWSAGDMHALGERARDVIDAVLAFYGGRDAEWLSRLSHRERPWRDARRGLGPEEPSDRQIGTAVMAAYYRDPEDRVYGGRPLAEPGATEASRATTAGVVRFSCPSSVSDRAELRAVLDRLQANLPPDTTSEEVEADAASAKQEARRERAACGA